MFRRGMSRRSMRRTRDRVGQSGYMLLVLMLAVAMLTITLLSVATNYRQSIRRDREVEMIHRGVQYERAVRLYYRKNNSYPPSIERLENTNKIRYLRKRYKDPMTPDGTWKIATLTDVNLPGTAGLGTQASGPVSPSSAGDESNRGIPTTAAGSGSQQSTGTGSATPAGDSAAPTIENRMPPDESATSGSTSGTAAGSPSNPNPEANRGASTGAGDQAPTATTGTASAFGGAVLGGGAMIGVISKSKREGIHSFNEKSRYNEWLFIYAPSQDVAQPGHIPNGPYNPKLNATAATGQGSPAAAPGATGLNPASPGN